MRPEAPGLPADSVFVSPADLLLTGRHITAAEAKEYGLVDHVITRPENPAP